MLTRRIMLRIGILATALSALNGRQAQASPMISKRNADYRNHPNDGRRCAACCMFVPGHPARCTMVEGLISPDGWCRYWKPGPPDSCQ